MRESEKKIVSYFFSRNFFPSTKDFVFTIFFSTISSFLLFYSLLIFLPSRAPLKETTIINVKKVFIHFDVSCFAKQLIWVFSWVCCDWVLWTNLLLEGIVVIFEGINVYFFNSMHLKWYLINWSQVEWQAFAIVIKV